MEQPHKTCNRCGESKSVDAFYVDKRRNRTRSSCKACCIKHQSPRSGKKTPKYRAEYRRRRGEVFSEYVPRTETARIAKERRAVKHSAHVGAWRQHVAMEERRRHVATLHDAHVRLFRNGTHDWRARYRTDPEFAIRQRLRTQQRKKVKLFPKLDDLVRDAIKRGGRSPTLADVCGYTVADLKQHIEQLFADGMSWEGFMMGDIHIDHVKPQRLFDLSDLDQVKECWALTNLQPLWARDNLAKGGKWNAARE